ncbi:MAG TPA: hypothetical protein VFW07_00870 [Parafilimonas sp.]|nr:hypothetical protein [Parafilimonas sp.]
MKANFILHVLTTVIGYILVLTGGGLMSRIINVKLNADICSKENETFPQGGLILRMSFLVPIIFPRKFLLEFRLQ